MITCSSCGAAVADQAKFCSECAAPTNATVQEAPSPPRAQARQSSSEGVVFAKGFTLSAKTGEAVNLDWSGETPYWQEEFRKIYESGETYRGKFNVAAFFLGAIWAIFRQTWFVGLVWIVLAVVTVGWALPVFLAYSLYFCFRANYIRYAAVVKGNQALIGD